MTNVSVIRTTDLPALAAAAARRFVTVVRNLLKSQDTVRVVLTGGTAGIETLKEIRALADEIDWSRVHIFFGDERNVPVTHPDSNEGQARAALLNHIDIPTSNVHGYGLSGEGMEAAVDKYAAVLATYAPDGFDLHLLGMGGEGHINTLFPHTDAVKENKALVVAEYHSPKPPAERVTLTLPAVCSAQRVWFLVAGANKAEAATKICQGADPVEWPAAGAHGRLETILFQDDAAAGL